MPEAVAAATAAVSEPVVATPGGDGKQQGAKPAPAAKQYDTPLDRVFGELGIGEDGSDMPSIGDITRKVEESGKAKPAPAAKPVTDPVAEPKEDAEPVLEEPKPASKTKKYKVGDKEITLTEEQADRFAQKGIHYEKQGVEIAKMQRQLQDGLAQIQQEREQNQALLKALATNPGAVLEELFGPEALKKIEPWAGERVLREMEYEKNPHLRAIHELEARAQAAELRAQQLEQATQQRETDQKATKLSQKYQQTIMQALEESGVAKTDFTAADMVREMKRAAAAGVDIDDPQTAKRIAEIVKTDHIERARALNEAMAGQIEQARQAGDMATVVKLGEQLVELHGEPVVYAIAKYHLARIRAGQPNQGNHPRQILETPRVPVQPKTGWGKNGRQYMSEDDYAEMRQKIARGEMEPPPGW